VLVGLETLGDSLNDAKASNASRVGRGSSGSLPLETMTSAGASVLVERRR